MTQDQETYQARTNHHAARQYTYETFAVRQIMPADGWSSVYYHDQEGIHFTTPVYALALVTRIRRDAETGEALQSLAPRGWSEAEDWDIVALEYYREGGWTIADGVSNYCGLLPPGETLEAFAADCLHHPSTPGKREQNDDEHGIG